MSRKSKLRSYPSKYPSKVDRNLPDSEWRKQRTLELYALLPQTSLEDRYKYTDIRDEVIFLNYNFFGYVASNVYLKGCHVSYEDKFQSALSNFCTMWHKYMYAKKYRTDLSFSVFFKLRLSECIRRELGTIKQSVNRPLKMEAAEQLGIHYNRLKYEDLSKIDLPPEKMASLKAIFKADFEEDIDTAAIFLPSKGLNSEVESPLLSDEYNDIEGLLVHEMACMERLLNLDDLEELSDMYGIPIQDLAAKQGAAEQRLHDILSDAVNIQSNFMCE